MQSVLLIRHGQAKYKAGHLYGRIPGVHLSDKGREEAANLAQRLDGVKLVGIYSSPLERCMETAEAVAKPRKMRVTRVTGLQEVEYGKWQGRTYKSLLKEPLWRTVQLWPSQARFPGGESILELQQRGVAAVEAIRTKHKKGIVAVFSHADMIKAIVAHYLGMHLDLFQRINVETASVSVVAFAGGFPRVLKLSETGALSSLLTPAPSNYTPANSKAKAKAKR